METIKIKNPFKNDENFAGFRIFKNNKLCTSELYQPYYSFEDNADDVEVRAIFYGKASLKVPFDIQMPCSFCKGSGFVKKV